MSASTALNAPLGTVARATATCPDGKKILGGGTTISVSVPAQLNRVAGPVDYPSGPNAWTGSIFITAALVGASATVTVYAVCTAWREAPAHGPTPGIAA